MSSASYSYIDYIANISISSDFAIRKNDHFHDASHTEARSPSRRWRHGSRVATNFDYPWSPSHSTQLLSPLHTPPFEVSFMKPLSTYTTCVKNWLRTNPGRVASHLRIAGLLGTSVQEGSLPAWPVATECERILDNWNLASQPADFHGRRLHDGRNNRTDMSPVNAPQADSDGAARTSGGAAWTTRTRNSGGAEA